MIYAKNTGCTVWFNLIAAAICLMAGARGKPAGLIGAVVFGVLAAICATEKKEREKAAPKVIKGGASSEKEMILDAEYKVISDDDPSTSAKGKGNTQLWKCRNCDELNEPQFLSCLNCRAAAPERTEKKDAHWDRRQTPEAPDPDDDRDQER